MSETGMTRRTSLERTIGLAGIAGMVLLFAATIAYATNEPELDASTAEAADFLRGLDASWITPVEAVADIGMMVLLWFMVGLSLLLRRHEGEVPVRSTVAMLSGVLVTSFVVLESAYQAGGHRSSDLDDAELALAYDLSQIGFTNIWLPMGSFAFACGWLMVSTSSMPRWLGWWGVAGGIALALAQLSGLSGVGWVPYLAFWVWLLTTCVVLVRTPATPDHRTDLGGTS
jgi:Domain of unknown function (DUF4386)